jgi:predicted  nucleic acid-binding Zn-ribbon protein
MSIARQLSQLQDIDFELESSEQALARVMAQIGESQGVVTTRQLLEKEKVDLEELKRQQHEAEWAVDDYTARISALDEKLYSGRVSNPKELSSLQQESEILKNQRSQAEDKALDLMERVSHGEARVTALTDKLQEMEKEWRAEQARLKVEAEQYRAQVAGLQEKRRAAVADIEPSMVTTYDGIKQQKGWAVARVERGTCRSCGISLSTAQLQQARGNELMRCSNCGRILFHA